MQYMNQISRAYAFTNPVICSEHTWYTWNGKKKRYAAFFLMPLLFCVDVFVAFLYFSSMKEEEELH